LEERIKVKVPHNRPEGPEGGRGIALLFLDLGTGRGWVASTTPWLPYTPGKIQYRLYRRLGGPQGQSWTCAKNLAPSGFDPQTVLPIGRE
jgi:hypothetical protein